MDIFFGICHYCSKTQPVCITQWVASYFFKNYRRLNAHHYKAPGIQMAYISRTVVYYQILVCARRCNWPYSKSATSIEDYCRNNNMQVFGVIWTNNFFWTVTSSKATDLSCLTWLIWPGPVWVLDAHFVASNGYHKVTRHHRLSKDSVYQKSLKTK